MTCFVEVSTKYSNTLALYFHFLRGTTKGQENVADTDPRPQEYKCIQDAGKVLAETGCSRL